MQAAKPNSTASNSPSPYCLAFNVPWLAAINVRMASAMSATLATGKSSPIIYLNACHAGAACRVVGRAGGFSVNLPNGGMSDRTWIERGIRLSGW